jgi:hypothetical protein
MDIDDFRPEQIWPYDPRLKPLPPPDVDICAAPVVNVCVNAQWWSHISGMIARLTYRDAWTGTDDEISDAIESIYKILDVGRPTMGCGCGASGLPSRVTADGRYQVSYDGGNTWVDAPELDPRTNATLPPPIGGDDGDDKRCKAANNVVRQMKDARDIFSRNLETGKTIVELAIALAGAIALIIFSGGELAPILIPLVTGLATALVNSSKAAYDGLFTPDVWDFVLCECYCNCAPDGTFNQSQFNQILSDCDGHFSGNLALTISSILNGWQLNGLNSAARIPSTDNLDCGACSCSDTCWDGWECILAPGDGPDPWGTILSVDGDLVELQSTEPAPGAHRILFANVAANNCHTFSWSLVGAGVYGCPCGHDIADWLSNLGPVSVNPATNSCSAVLFADGSAIHTTLTCTS